MTSSAKGYLSGSTWFRPGIILLAIVLFTIIVYLPRPEDLTEAGQKSLAIFCVCVLLWVSHALPLMITSLLAVILFPLTGVLSTNESFALFGNRAIFFILGAFILASGLMRSGLSTRLALLALRGFGRTPRTLVLGFLLSSAFLSFWMSEHAVAAMMFPIVFEVTDALNLTPGRSRYGKALFLGMTWGCIIGGVATFLGGARAPLALGILQETTGHSIDFFHWMLATLPTVLIMLVIAFIVLMKGFSPDVRNIADAQIALKRKQLRMGRMSLREKVMGALMLFTVLAWIFYGEQVGLANIAIVAVVVAFVLQLLDWKEVEEDVNWGIFLMYGGAICLGVGMEITGAAGWIADRTLGYFVHSPAMLILALSCVALFLTEAISNSAVVALLMPIALGFAADLNFDPRLVTLAVAVPSGLAFSLPMSTPATAIAYSSGFVSLRDTLLGGMVLNVSAWVVFNVSVYFYWPLIGFKL